jgi:radical SAM protein with 4Fe4S-binding SPASM domain
MPPRETPPPLPDACAGRPIEQVSIAVVTGICQLRCIYCPTHDIKRGKGFVDVEFFRSLVNSVKPRIVNLQGYGEPTLHPDFERLLRLAADDGRIVKFFSHLNRWTPELARLVVDVGVHQIIVSIDAFSKEKYAQIRKNGNLDDLCATVREIKRSKEVFGRDKPELLYNTVVIHDTVDEIPRAFDFAEEMGDGQPVFELVNDYGFVKIAALAERRLERLHDALLAARNRAVALGWKRSVQNIDFNIDSVNVPDPDQFVCYRPWRLLTVTENGDVIPCGEYHEGQVVFGNVRESSIDTVWEGRVARAFRAELLRGRSRLEVCSRCTVNEGATVDLFHPWQGLP